MPSDPYRPTWAMMRRRRPWGWVGLTTFVIGLGLIRSHTALGLSLALVSFLVLGYASPGNCPRCGKTFGRKGAFHNQFTTRCLNCGIRIGDPKDPQ